MALKILVGALLLLGITNPVASNLPDVAAAGFIFGFATYLVFTFFKKQILFPSVFLLVVSWVLFTYVKGPDQTFMLSSLLGYLVSVLTQKNQLLKKSAIWILITIFLLDSFAISKDLRNWLTTDIPYNNDPGVLLATYRQIENGADYYEAYKTAQLGRFAQNIIPADIWGWRLPTIFYIWKLFPGQTGLSIYILYLIVASALLLVAFQIAKRYLDENLAFLSPYLLFPYLHFGSRDQMFLETEWWGVSMFVFGLYFLVKRRLFLATIVLTTAVLVREVYLLPLGLIVLYAFAKDKKLVPVLAIPIVAFLILFAFHFERVSDYINARETLFSPRVVSNGIYFIQQTLAFASWEYLLFKFRPFILFLPLAVAGCLMLFKNNFKKESIVWLLSFLPFPISFLKFGTVPYNDYWGIIYMPLVLILAPLSTLLLTSQPNQSGKSRKK